jgi:DNA-binding transcriptional regulator YiaG
VPSYCCFFCPAATFDEKSLKDACPTCGRAYGYPLDHAPDEIGDYRILRPLDRGFYGATYVAERKSGLKLKSVLKVTPKSFYEFFPEKNFVQECELHQSVSEGTEHLVKIRDMMPEVEVSFGDVRIACCVAELEYVEGPLLREYFEGTQRVTAQVAAQIAIDLLRLRDELERREIFHNDLHAGNIIVERLRKDRFRADALDHSIRAVAIDLGSASTQSRSNPAKQRLGDLAQIANHIAKLVGGLLSDPDDVSDHDFRLASALQNIFHVLAAPAENIRVPAAHELIRQIVSAYEMLSRHSWRPWTQPLALSTFGSYYNALTLEAWHVPALLIDPEGAWLDQIGTPGPQVITGMRGCGKTMLLRALQFHARASRARGETDADAVERIKKDRYVGLFVSAQRLLDKTDGAEKENGDPFVRLVLAYALEGVRSVNVSAVRRRTGLSQAAFSRQIGVSPGTLRN